MLKRFAFRAKILYLCTSEEEKARKHWAFSSFFAQYKGCITPDLEKFLREIEFFLSESGFSLGQVGERIDVPEKF
ncbi:MAG: hypothetical protein MR505_08310 [Bacteroidales bacterium]|nr:hypothetical protein [Bacteroidales bacterium]